MARGGAGAHAMEQSGAVMIMILAESLCLGV